VSGKFSPPNVGLRTRPARSRGRHRRGEAGVPSWPHDAAMRVLAEGLHELGILEEDPETALRKDRQLHRRYTLHGVSHMLGLDVHDCANARNEEYLGELAEATCSRSSRVSTSSQRPHGARGVPRHWRAHRRRRARYKDGAKNLSEALPREPNAIEDWMTELWSTTTPTSAFEVATLRETRAPMTTSRPTQ